MFICDTCHTSTKPGQPLTRVVIESRVKHYLNRNGEVEGVGSEIVREINVGPCCKEQ